MSNVAKVILLALLALMAHLIFIGIVQSTMAGSTHIFLFPISSIDVSRSTLNLFLRVEIHGMFLLLIAFGYTLFREE